MASTFNEGEVEHGKIAAERSANLRVVDFAVLMSSQYGSLLAPRVSLIEAVGVSSNPLSTELEAESSGTAAQLLNAPSPEFDRLYMRSEVARHEQALDLLRVKLIPDAQDERVMDYLERLEKYVAEYLDMAKRTSHGLP